MLDLLFPDTVQIPIAIEIIVEFLLVSGVLFAILRKTGFFKNLKDDVVTEMNKHMDDAYLPRLEEMAKSTHLCSMQDDIKELLVNSRETQRTVKLLTSSQATLLRDRLIQLYHDKMEKGDIDEYSLKAATDMHDKYKELGGNGYIDLLYQKLTELPTVD